MKQKIKLNENQLHQIIKESVKRVLNEISLKTLTNARDKAYNDVGGYSIKKSLVGVDVPGWEPSKDFYKAIGNDSKRTYAKRMCDKRSKQYQAFDDEVKKRQNSLIKLVYDNQAEFENAIDCLYYGEGKQQWFERAQESMSPEDAKNLWKIAFQFVSQDEVDNWKDWIQGYGPKDFFGYKHKTDGIGINYSEF